MSGNRWMIVSIILLLFFSLQGQKKCITDRNCPKFYQCSFGTCIIDESVFNEDERISIKKGAVFEHDTYLEHKVTDKSYDVVLGALKFTETPLSGKSPSMIKRINFKFEKSSNIEIENVRLVHDVNWNGKFDANDRVIMNEPSDSYGTNSRFIQYADNADLLDIDGKMNFLIVADYNVDTENNKWPAYVKISSIESILFSSNVVVVQDDTPSMSFDSISLYPWGKVVFLDISNSSIVEKDGGSAKLSGVFLTATENTSIRKISFEAERYVKTIIFGYQYSDHDGLYYLTLEDKRTGQKIYSITSSEWKKEFDVNFEIVPGIPVEIIIETPEGICSDSFKISFSYDSIEFSDDDIFFYGAPAEVYGSMFWDSDECSNSYYGCSF